MMVGLPFLSVCVITTFTHMTVSDVVVETKKNFRTFRIIEDFPAWFGDDLPEDGLVGYIMPAEPKLACSPIKPPPVIEPEPGLPALHWIALIRDNPDRWRSEANSQDTGC